MPEDSKVYERNLELYGGKANVLADRLRRWFVGLWHGTPLAIIVASVTILASFGVLTLPITCRRPSITTGSTETTGIDTVAF